MSNPTRDADTGIIIFGDNYSKRNHFPLLYSPTNNDWFRVFNGSGGLMYFLSDLNINGYNKPFISRRPEWLNVQYDISILAICKI